MFSVKIFTIHSWEYISWKWTCLIEIWITWFQQELDIPQFQIPHMKSQKKLWKSDLNLVTQGCQHEKILNITSRIWTWDLCIRYKYFDIGPASQIHKIPTKLLMRRGNKSAKPVSDRQEWVLGSSQWNYYWFVGVQGILLWWSCD